MLSFKPDSSFVREVEFDSTVGGESGELKVTLANGVYFYKVPHAEFEAWGLAMLNGQSAGEYYNANIRGQYPSRREHETWPRTVSNFTVKYEVTHDSSLSPEQVQSALMSALNLKLVPGYVIELVSVLELRQT